MPFDIEDRKEFNDTVRKGAVNLRKRRKEKKKANLKRFVKQAVGGRELKRDLEPQRIAKARKTNRRSKLREDVLGFDRTIR